MSTKDVHSDQKRQPQVIIIGAGLAGISAAIALKQQLHFENFTIYERASAVGGTWRDNTYPGCGSDVPGHWYSLSTELNPYWSSYYVSQPEIQAYWESVHQKHNLSAHTQFNTEYKSAVWDTDRQLYKIVLEDKKTAKEYEIEAEGIIFAIGGFMSPMYPKDVPGAERFRGVAWHSARWNHDVELKGKRVGVVGNGCSAAQFVPKISEDPSVQVVNFVRTPQWYVPQSNYRYPAWVKWMFAHIPLIMRFYRNWIMARSDLSFLIFRKGNSSILKLIRKQCVNYLKYKAPKNQHDKIIPNYPPGCKRIIVNPGYLDALHRPNVTLSWDRIDCIVEEGIKLGTGEVVPLDVIIFGTGYSIVPANLQVRGSYGKTIHEYFDSQDGATAYLGTCIPGFPNVFTMLGPNTATGHASVIFTEEVQINFAMQLLKPIIEGKAKSFEVTDQATIEYNQWLQGRLSTSVWTECNSYYRGLSKIVVTFPGPVSLFWWMARKPHWEHFKAVGAESWFQQLKYDRIRKLGLVGIALSLAVGSGIFLPSFAHHLVRW